MVLCLTVQPRNQKFTHAGTVQSNVHPSILDSINLSHCLYVKCIVFMFYFLLSHIFFTVTNASDLQQSLTTTIWLETQSKRKYVNSWSGVCHLKRLFYIVRYIQCYYIVPRPLWSNAIWSQTNCCTNKYFQLDSVFRIDILKYIFREPWNSGCRSIDEYTVSLMTHDCHKWWMCSADVEYILK